MKKEGFYTTKETLDLLSCHLHSFHKYAEKFGIKGLHEGRETFYRKEDIKKLDNAIRDRVPWMIDMIQRLTGMDVVLIERK